MNFIGEMTEWTNVPDSKSGVGATPPRVRIPLSPPELGKNNSVSLGKIRFLTKL